jgi:hypothetical protein
LSEIPKNLAENLASTLNSHGYSLQYSVLKELRRLRTPPNKLPWSFEVAEFPVAINDQGTKIDILLQHDAKKLLLIGECKRADPKNANWCFARAPYVRRERDYEYVFLERVRLNSEWLKQEGVYKTTVIDADGVTAGNIRDAYHLAFELKSQHADDHEVSDKSEARGKPIEAAVSQVLRGLNGFCEWIGRVGTVVENRGAIFLIPAVFTTARLWVSDVDLSSARLDTGRVDPSSVQVAEAKWVAYQYPVSPALKHSIRPSTRTNSIAAELDHEFLRTVFVVNTGGLEDFMNYLSSSLAV